MTEWWTVQQSGLIGGIGGAVVGILGGVIGTLAGAFARKGKLKPVVMALLTLLIVVCAAALLVGVTALVMKQPYHVWYPLMLIGFIGSTVGATMIPVMRNVYRQAEHRRFEAEQLRRA